MCRSEDCDLGVFLAICCRCEGNIGDSMEQEILCSYIEKVREFAYLGDWVSACCEQAKFTFRT